MYTRWLFVPFSSGHDDEVFKMAQVWKSVEDWKGKRTVIVRYANNRDNAGCLSKVAADDKLYILAHGNVGCVKVANKFSDATEELSVNDLCERIQESGLPTEYRIVVNLFACGAGGRAEVIAGCGSGAVFADDFARALRERYYYFDAEIYGYKESVTSPEQNDDLGYKGKKLAVGVRNEVLGRASEFKQRFRGY